MDKKKLEKLENIKNYLENDDITGLTKYIDRIKPLVKDDGDFQEIFDELKNKNYDQALFLAEDFIFENDDPDYEDDFDKLDLDELDEKENFSMEEPVEDLDDFDDDLDDDMHEDSFDDLSFFDEKDDTYF